MIYGIVRVMSGLSISPARLKQVREARSLAPSEAAERLGISRQTLYAYEAGRQTPRAGVVERIADVYEVAFALLTREPTPCDGVRFYRRLASVTKRARVSAERRVEWLFELYDLLSNEVVFPEWRLPKIANLTLEELGDQKFLETLATQLRASLGLKDGPVPDALRAFEELGVVFTRLPLDKSKLDAFSLFSASRGRGFVVLNSDKGSAVRSRADVCHEAFHLMTHARMPSIPEGFAKDRVRRKMIEDPAQTFPGAFLFPREPFLELVTSHSTLDDLLRIKPKWKVSVASMVMRAYKLGVFSSAKRQAMFKLINYRGWRKREPFDDRLVVERPQLLGLAFEAVATEDAHRVRRIISNLGFGDRDVEHLCGLQRGLLEQLRQPTPLRLRVKGED